MEWKPIRTAPKDGHPFIAYGAALIHEDFNPTGVVEAFYAEDEGIVGLLWNPSHDCWYPERIRPTHWMRPTPPV